MHKLTKKEIDAAKKAADKKKLSRDIAFFSTPNLALFDFTPDFTDTAPSSTDPGSDFSGGGGDSGGGGGDGGW